MDLSNKICHCLTLCPGYFSSCICSLGFSLCCSAHSDTHFHYSMSCIFSLHQPTTCLTHSHPHLPHSLTPSLAHFSSSPPSPLTSSPFSPLTPFSSSSSSLIFHSPPPFPPPHTDWPALIVDDGLLTANQLLTSGNDCTTCTHTSSRPHLTNVIMVSVQPERNIQLFPVHGELIRLT